MHPSLNFHTGFRRRQTLLAAAAAAVLGLAAAPAFGQAAAWPTKPVRLIVGFAPGGGTDVMARSVAQTLTEILGQTFVVENKPGGSGTLSASEVARASADGYTFLVAPTSVETVNPSIFKHSDVRPSRDLTPVMGVARMQMYVVARPTLKVTDAKQLIALAKSQPGKLNYASSGAGTPPHLAGELFNQSAGIQTAHIPYRGSAPALQDVMANQADFVFDPGTALPHIKAGKVKLLAVASDRKSPFLPDAPTYADLGIKDAGLDIWYGVWAPHKVPPEITERLSRALTQALADPALTERFHGLGAEPVALDNASFRQLLTEEAQTLSSLIAERKIIAD